MVQYSLWRDCMTGAYGVCAWEPGGAYGLVTASAIREVRSAQDLIRTLNRLQIPVSDFREWILAGGLSTPCELRRQRSGV